MSHEAELDFDSIASVGTIRWFLTTEADASGIEVQVASDGTRPSLKTDGCDPVHEEAAVDQTLAAL